MLLRATPRAWLAQCSARSLPLTRAMSAGRPVLPESLEIDVRGQYKLTYVDLKPPPHAPSGGGGDAKPTIVLIHGSPGSYQDYKYLIPLLADRARVIGIDLPGNGGSVVVDQGHYYERIEALNLAHAARDALAQICGDDENVFVVGHSFGGHATINVAALNEMEGDAGAKLHIRGLALLASAGLRIHRGLEVGNLGELYGRLTSADPAIEAAAREATRELYTSVWRFPSKASTDHYVAGLVRCASTDFGVIRDHVKRIQHLPAFFAWAKDDLYIQQEIFRELSDACHGGPRFAFETGGHNIQKTKAEFIANQLLQWTESVARGDAAVASSASRAIVEQP